MDIAANLRQRDRAAFDCLYSQYAGMLFGIIRKQSLLDLGLNAQQVTTVGEDIISIQMVGLLIGGVIWGIMGDKKGRLSVLFGSIILYSLANIANGLRKATDPTIRTTSS